MNDRSASRADEAAEPPRRVLVWDAPVRVFHWLLVLSFAVAWITGDSENWRALHVTMGYTLAGLVAFRLLWGVLGTRHARFASFVHGPRTAWRYLGSLVRGRPEHHVGHNPAGGLAIVALLVLAVGTALAGWATYENLADLEDLHEGLANAMLALVGLHVAAVVVSSWLHRENLVAAMFTGRKQAAPADGIGRAWHGLAVLMLAGVLGFWALQWQDPPDVAAHERHAGTRVDGGGHDRDRRGGHDDDD